MNLELRVQRSIDLIDSGQESLREWEFLRKLATELRAREADGSLNKRGRAILAQLTPFFQQHSL